MENSRVVLATAVALLFHVFCSTGEALAQEHPVASPVNACSDFYEFANGSWIATHPIPPELPTYGTGNVVAARTRETIRKLLIDAASSASSDERSAAVYFDSCMDEPAIERAGLSPLARELRRIDSIRSAAEAASVALHLQTIGVNAWVTTYTEADRKNSSERIAVIQPPTHGLDRSDLVETSSEAQAARDAYAHYVARILRRAGSADEEAFDAARQVIRFETVLAAQTLTSAQRRDVEATYHAMSTAEIADAFPLLRPVHLFALLEVELPERVNVAQPAYFAALERELARTPPLVLRSYLRFRLLDAYASTLPRRFRDAAFAFEASRHGAERPLPRWRQCVVAADADLGGYVGRLYAAKTQSASDRARVSSLASNVLASVATLIRDAEWLGEKAKQRALVKASRIRFALGGPPLDVEHLPRLRQQAYASVAKASARFTTRIQLARLGNARDPWTLSPAIPSAMFDQTALVVYVTAAQLQPPYFDAEADDAANYGAIGAIIGHELIHAFDDKGSRFGENGNVADWWSDRDRTMFAERVDCVKRRLRAVKLDGQALDADNTVGEAIADRGGMKAAWRAYLATHPGGDDAASAQRFVLAFARMYARHSRRDWLLKSLESDNHLPSPERVAETLQGSEALRAAYDCGEPDECEVW